MILALIASLAVATANAGGCVTTEDQYASVLRTNEGPGTTGTRISKTTSDPGKACMTYAEVSYLRIYRYIQVAPSGVHRVQNTGNRIVTGKR